MEFLEIAKSILKANPKCSLSGSLALQVQGIKIRRPVKDIDIFLPYGVEFIKIDGLLLSLRDEDNQDYEPDGWIRDSYNIGGVQVDVFTPEDEIVIAPEIISKDKMSLVKAEDIIKHKVAHSFGDHHTRFKHRDDIIHILINNVS